MLSLIFLLLLAYAGLVSSADSASGSNKHISNIFILAGQSNMSGRGGVINRTWDGVVPPQCAPNPSVLRLDADLNWVEAQEPLHSDIDVNDTCGVSPGMAFANSLLNKAPSFEVIGLVPCAIGGTKITQWERGSVLYSQMINRTKAALHSGGKLRALLWYQGESDTKTIEDSLLYGKRLKRFFTDVRIDLQTHTLPLIQVVLASGRNFTEKVRQGQLEVRLRNLKSVDGMGLELMPDGIHLTTMSQVQLGDKLANAILETDPLSIQTSGASRNSDYSLLALYL